MSFAVLGGAEGVVDVIAEMYPDADIYTMFSANGDLPPHVLREKLHIGPLQRISRSLHLRETYLIALFPWAIERLDLTRYDLIFSSCGPVQMGVHTREDAIHICYCHSPQRIWWDQYAEFQAQLPWIPRQFFVLCASYIRLWEFCAIQRVDHVVSNSKYIAQRVFKYFRQNSTVIYPPVDTLKGYLASQPDDYYLTVSRLHIGKRVDLLIHACNRLSRRLLVVGAGKEESMLKSIAGPTIEFLGRVPDSDLSGLYAHCRAFIFAANEDFGIAPVEAQAFGRPVIAYGHGGSLETVRVGDDQGASDTGILFPEQTIESVMDGIQLFEAREQSFIPEEIQRHARKFDKSVFIRQLRELVDLATLRK